MMWPNNDVCQGSSEPARVQTSLGARHNLALFGSCCSRFENSILNTENLPGFDHVCLGFHLLTCIFCLCPCLAAKQPPPLVVVNTARPLPALLPCQWWARPAGLVRALAWGLETEEIVVWILLICLLLCMYFVSSLNNFFYCTRHQSINHRRFVKGRTPPCSNTPSFFPSTCFLMLSSQPPRASLMTWEPWTWLAGRHPFECLNDCWTSWMLDSCRGCWQPSL